MNKYKFVSKFYCTIRTDLASRIRKGENVCMFATDFIKAARSSHLSSQGFLSYSSSIKINSYHFFSYYLRIWMYVWIFVDSGIRIVKRLLGQFSELSIWKVMNNN